MDGIEAAKAIKAADGDVSILMLTGSNSRTDVDRARQAGAAGYVTKDRIAADQPLKKGSGGAGTHSYAPDSRTDSGH